MRRSAHDLILDEPGTHRFERVLNRLPQAVVLVDRDLVIEYANPAAHALLGGAPQGGEPLPDPWPSFSLRALAASLFGSSPPTDGTLVRSPDRTLWITGVPPSEMGDAILIIEEITDRERARRSEREFVENAAHELRTPLAAIISVMDVLEGGAKEIPETRDRFLKHIRVHSDRLSRLATSLLVLARLQAGVEHPRLKAVAVRPVLDAVAEGLQTFEGVEVRVVAASDIGVIADRDLLHQIVVNVAENAAKNTQSGEIVLEARAKAGTTEIEIRDTGSGMSAAAQERAFDRFYRSDGRGKDGFGLGLAIAGEAVAALSGTIALESTPGTGTRVRVALPTATMVA